MSLMEVGSISFWYAASGKHTTHNTPTKSRHQHTWISGMEVGSISFLYAASVYKR